MEKVKKAKYGDGRITRRQEDRLGRISEKNPERAKDVAERMRLRATRRKRGRELYNSLEPKEDLPAFKARTMEEAKNAKNGKSFPDLNKDGKITKADILKGRGVIAKSGTMMKMGGKAAKQAAIAISMKKAGITPKKKMQYGGAAASMKPTSKVKKAQAGKSMDSTGIYKKRAEDAGNKLLKDDVRNFGKNIKDFATKQADSKRYQRKGKPGFDEQGNRKPLSLKFKLKRAQAGSKVAKYVSPYKSEKTADSTQYFKDKEKDIIRASSEISGNFRPVTKGYKLDTERRNSIDREYDKERQKVMSDLNRQGAKGKPGFDKYGNPMTYKQASGSKKKDGGKVKKAQSGLTASNKRVGPVDPKGAWTKVQEMNLPPRNVKTKVSLTRDKQLGATKMMKSGGKMKKK